MNELNSYTIYREYWDLITILPDEEEQAKVLLAMTKYMFEDLEMDLTERERKIFVNLKRPLNKSKEQSKRRTKQKPNENQKETESKPNEEPNENTSNDVNVNVHDNVNVDILENMGYGEKKPFKDIIDYLNQRANTHFKYNSKSTQSKINARLNEGYVLDDFIVVIDKKCDEWLNTDFEQYLCPETLFGTKFEKYLNQKVTKPKRTLKDISMAEIDMAIELERGGKEKYDEDGIF